MIAIILVAVNCLALRWLIRPAPVAVVALVVVLLPINLLLIGL